jgi:hypothetical protein
VFEGRLFQMDLRFIRDFRLRPTSVLDARLLEFGVQMNFWPDAVLMRERHDRCLPGAPPGCPPRSRENRWFELQSYCPLRGN